MNTNTGKKRKAQAQKALEMVHKGDGFLCYSNCD